MNPKTIWKALIILILYIALMAILAFVVGLPVSREEGVVYYPEDGEAYNERID